MKPLKPEKGEKFVPPGLDTTFKWDGKMWVDTGVKAVPMDSEAMNGKTG
jgi:hypothetical protein